MPQLPDDGIHRDVVFEDYERWPAINSGKVRWMQVSSLHGHAAMRGLIKSDDTPDRRFGRLAHCWVLEGESAFMARFPLQGTCQAALKSGDRKGDACGASGRYVDFDGNWYCGAKNHAPIGVTEPTEFFKVEELERIKGMAERLHGHDAMKLLSRSGYSEASLLWTFPGNPDLRMKGRLDRYAEADETREPFVIDFKKMQVGAGSTEDCEKAILNYHYHWQAAIYVEGVERLTGRRPQFCWVFQEDNPPYDLNVIPAAPRVLEIGWWQVSQAVEKYRRGVRDGFRGYIYHPSNIKFGGLPAWELRRWEGHDFQNNSME